MTAEMMANCSFLHIANVAGWCRFKTCFSGAASDFTEWKVHIAFQAVTASG
jgi:hypothetical protein